MGLEFAQSSTGIDKTGTVKKGSGELLLWLLDLTLFSCSLKNGSPNENSFETFFQTTTRYDPHTQSPQSYVALKNSNRVTCEVLRQAKSRTPAQTCWAGVSLQVRSRDLLTKHSKPFSHHCIQKVTKQGYWGTCLELLKVSYLSPGQGATSESPGFYSLSTTTGHLWDHVPHKNLPGLPSVLDIVEPFPIRPPS